MLAQLRTFSKSWLARGLLLILVIGMGIWGIEHAVNVTGMSAVAKVDGQSITPNQVSRELDLFLRGRNREQQTMTRPQAIEAGVQNRLLDSMISRRALQSLAEKLGISASDAQVANAIRGIPAVQNGVTGGFSKDSYDAFLQDVGYTQSEFEHEMRGDLSTAMLMQSLTAGVRAPASFSSLFIAFETERRTISLAEISAAQAGAIPAPTDQQIQAFYREHREQLRTPEYRALTLIYARASDFAARVQVSDQRLREEFQRRSASLSEPERRTFVQISAPDDGTARDAAQRLASGQDPDAAARALGLQVVRYENSVRGDVADASVAGAVFGMAANATPTAVRGRLSPWAAVKLTAVRAAVAPSFEAERDRLRSEIANDEAGDQLNEAISAFEEARGGGTPAADAARANGLSVVQIPAVDEQGRTPQGQPAEGLIDQADLIRTAFQTAEGESSDFTPAGDGVDVMVAVDRITPAATKPLNEVRDQLVQAWTAEQRAERLQSLAENIVREINGGKSFADAVRDHRLTVQVRSQAADRRLAAQLPSRDLPAAIFRAREGQGVSGMRVDGGAAIVGVVEKIERATPAQVPQMVQAAQQQMQQALGESLTNAVAAQAVTRAHVSRNEALMRQTFGTGEQNQQSQ